MKGRVLRGAVVGIGAGVVAAAARELVRPRGGQVALVDWEEAGAQAASRLAGAQVLSADTRAAAEARYARLAAEVRTELLRTLRADPATELPAFEALDPIGWAALNVRILAETMQPLLAAGDVSRSHLSELGRRAVDAYIGSILAFLGRRVLGQFDPHLLGKEVVMTGSLYLVEPNIAAWEAAEGLEGDDLRRWLILHESTHAWQFSAHPWLRDHLNSGLESVLAAAGERAPRNPLLRAVALTVGLPSQWAEIRRLQATMSLVEGYSNLVMNLAGRRSLAAFDRIESAYRRRSRRGAVELLIWKLTGLDLKLKQYSVGEAFCQAVYDQYGMEVLNLAWRSQEMMPSGGELTRPERWYARIQALRAESPGIARV